MTIGLWLSAAAVICYFAPKPVLFERNLSLAIFAAVVVLALLSWRSRPALACAAIAALPMGYWSTQIALASANSQRFDTWAATNMAQSVPDYWGMPWDELPKCRGLLLVRDYNDGFSRRLIEKAVSEGYAPVARYRSRFDSLPASTLQGYVDAGRVLLRCKE